MNVVIFDIGCVNLSLVKFVVVCYGYILVVSCEVEIVLCVDKFFLFGVGMVQVVMD